MQKKLKKVIERYGIMPVSIALGYHDTGAVKKWLVRGVPKRMNLAVSEIVNSSGKTLSLAVIKEIKRRFK